jgi:hypothetical protein
MATAPEQIAMLYPWIPPDAIQAYSDLYNEGSVEPWLGIRTDSRYEQWFPGNMDDDGNIRYGEDSYAGVREAYRDVVRSMNLNDQAFEDQFTALMEGEVSPSEFEARASEVYDRVISASDAIKNAFAEANGFEITTEGILASALDPDLGDKILSQEIGMAEISGAATESGFTLGSDRIAELEAFGVTLDQARGVYGQAASTLPVLDMLAARHDDPDDDFDLNEFEQAEIFNDPFQNRRMRRLISQERSTFTQGASVRATRGALTGLVSE